MPGIYVNDGGATSSAIGNILGGIAQEVGPEGAAKAALLAQQTQGADISNQDAYEKLLAGEAAANAAAGLTRTLNMNAPDPGQPSVAGTVTSLSQPPSATPGPGGRISRIDESGFTPEQKYIANEILNGRMSPAALQTGVDVFSTPLVGAGMTPGVIRTRSTTALSPGQVFPSGPAATGGGGSSYVHAGDEAAGAADYKLAMDDLESGGNAKANLGKIDPIIDLFKSAVAPGVANTGAKIQGDLLTKLVTSLGGDPNKYLDANAAKALLKQNLLSFIGGLRDSAGNPLPRGATDLIVQQIPDPETDLNGFLAGMNWVKAHLQSQAARADAAQTYVNERQTNPNAGPAFHTARGAAWSAEQDAYAHSGLKGGEGEGGGGPRPPKTTELQEFQARVARGEDARKLIRNARSAGVDMTLDPKD
jgi:hypothetical protein